MMRLPLLLIVALLTAAEPLQLDLQRGHQTGLQYAKVMRGCLLTADPEVVCVWDLASRSLRWQATATPQVLSHDGSLLACSVSYRVELRRFADGERIRNVNAFWIMGGDGARPGFVESVELSPDGRWIIACGPEVEADFETPDGDVLTAWFPVDGNAMKTIDWEPGAVGTDPPDTMEEPARVQPGRLLGLDAAGRALVRHGDTVRAVPAPGEGDAVVAPEPPDGIALGGGRLSMSSHRFTWSGPLGTTGELAIKSRLPNLPVRRPGSLDWCVRDGLLVGVGADAEDATQSRDIGAVYRWRLPDCTPLPMLTVPGTRLLRLTGDLLIASIDPVGPLDAEGTQAGSRVALLTWGPQATVAGTPQPFARLPDFPPITTVRCDANSAWIQHGSRWRRFALADGADLPLGGEPPAAAPGSDFADVAGEESDQTWSVPPAADAPTRQRLLAKAMHPNREYQHLLGRPFAWAWLATDGSHGWSASGPHLFLYRPKLEPGDGSPVLIADRRDLVAHAGGVSGAALTPDRRLLVTSGWDGICAVWRLPDSLWQAQAAGEPVLLYRRITTRTGGWLAMAPDGTYAGTRDAIDGVAARRGSEVFPVSQAELSHHRPDLLLARIGLAPQERIAALRRAWELRLRRLGADPAQVTAPVTAQASFDTRLPVFTDQPTVRLAVSGRDDGGPPARLMLTVDGVPLPDRHGLGIGRAGVRRDGSTLAAEIDVPLAHGANTIELAAVGADGREGPLRRLVVNRTGTPAPRLVVAAVGVSRHTRSELDLRHAAGDARRAAAAITALPGYAGSASHLALDAEATRSGILALRERLAATTPDDTVVLFLAGHGVLDQRQEWWFLTHDGDPDRPEAGCVAYHEVEGLLDGIPARRRLLIMDTCHAGEVDAAAMAPRPGLAVRAVRGLKRIASTGSSEDARLMREVFIDLRRAAGAIVIAASAGQEVAFEGDRWQGGAFTRALLDALADPAADLDGDRALDAREWRAAVAGRVLEMTGGQQQPVVRADNPLADIVLRRW